jgi:hypothetical protein
MRDAKPLLAHAIDHRVIDREESQGIVRGVFSVRLMKQFYLPIFLHSKFSVPLLRPSCDSWFPKSSRFSSGNGRRGVSGTGPGPRPEIRHLAGTIRYQVPSPDTPFECAFPWGQPASPGPFNLWILRAAVDRRREVVGRCDTKLITPPPLGGASDMCAWG